MNLGGNFWWNISQNWWVPFGTVLKTFYKTWGHLSHIPYLLFYHSWFDSNGRVYLIWWQGLMMCQCHRKYGLLLIMINLPYIEEDKINFSVIYHDFMNEIFYYVTLKKNCAELVNSNSIYFGLNILNKPEMNSSLMIKNKEKAQPVWGWKPKRLLLIRETYDKEKIGRSGWWIRRR